MEENPMRIPVLAVSAGAVMGCAGIARADGFEWLNVEKFPDGIEATADGWSAIRSEAGEISHRVAADDFTIDAPTRISAIEWWTVEILQNPLLGVDWYVFTGPDEGPPQTLVAFGSTVPTPHAETGLVNASFGKIFLERVEPEDLVLEPGHYFLAFRVVQALPPGEKGIGSLTTRWSNGTSRGWWNFDLLANGAVAGPWFPMSAFNLDDNEWAFRISGEAATKCRADCNQDGSINIFDFLCFQGLVTTGNPEADCNGDGAINIFDFLCFQGLVTIGCE
jgi:hypothetical protein